MIETNRSTLHAYIQQTSLPRRAAMTHTHCHAGQRQPGLQQGLARA